jgi:3-methyladenine DNA glycosylase AlkC
MKEKFSLKDHLFNPSKIKNLAESIVIVYPTFNTEDFISTVIKRFPELELKQRITWITVNLKKFLPENYPDAVAVLLRSLPPENDPNKSDNDFGDFIYAPYAEFVAKYGCNKKDLEFSLNALKEITMRFSAEDAIRYFINAFPKETLQRLQEWAEDSHYHVRRLASEGTRPKLPWAQKINIAPEDALPILNKLYFDKTRFVTRSVANHINDISKINPELVIHTLKQWKNSGRQTEKEMQYIVNHSLRTLVKIGYPDAIAFLDFSPEPKVKVQNFTVSSEVRLGDFLYFEFSVLAEEDENIIADYTIYFPKKAGTGLNKKVFKIKKFNIKKNQQVTITKRHRLKADMTTRKLQPGKHTIEIQLNGKKFTATDFMLLSE